MERPPQHIVATKSSKSTSKKTGQAKVNSLKTRGSTPHSDPRDIAKTAGGVDFNSGLSPTDNIS